MKNEQVRNYWSRLVGFVFRRQECRGEETPGIRVYTRDYQDALIKLNGLENESGPIVFTLDGKVQSFSDLYEREIGGVRE